MSNPGQAGLCPHNPLLVKVMPCTSCACCSRCDACRDNTGKRICTSKFSACQGSTVLFLQASRSFTTPVFCAALLPVGAQNSDTSPRQRYLHPCLLIQLSRCSYSFANHPGGLLPVWEFTLRDCCAIMATMRVCVFCCRHPNVSNLRVLFVWRMDIISF